MNKQAIVSGIGIVVAGLALVGCAVEDGEYGELTSDELAEIGETEQAIGTECAGATPVVTFLGGIDYTSPQTYNTASCYKALAVDVQNYSAAFVGPGDIPGHTAVEWADSLPNTQSACQSLWVNAYLFEKVGSSWQVVTSRQSFGAWMSFFGSFYCSGPGVSFDSEMQAGKTYRIAATARTQASSSAPTRRFHMVSREPVIIR